MKKIFYSMLMACTFSALSSQTISNHIVTDQFGYLPQAKKIAVIRNPKTGFDAADSFLPGSSYGLINCATRDTVFTSILTKWKNGATDASSGDQAWYFDFSSVSAPGRYFVLDIDRSVRSTEFVISPIVYKEVLKHAVRFFFYQRVGFPKEARYAGAAWADGASHIGALQDKNCRLYNDKNNAATELDLSGGWYDAGDYNKYTSWTANYVVEMMKAYLENPTAWGDDYNLPESGNGFPDLLDEARWGIDFLLRMQRPNGGVLCIVGVSHNSPPSAAKGQSLYGPATTAATLNTAGALAIASKVFRLQGMTAYADTLLERAQKAYSWALTNPAVTFVNNSSSNGSQGLAAGNQEEDDYGRLMDKLEAACFLFEQTGNTDYKTFFEANYKETHFYKYNSFAYPFETVNQEILLYYSTLSGATASIASGIKSAYRQAMLSNTDNYPARNSLKDPYRAHLGSYTWGSNGVKCAAGSMYTDLLSYNVDSTLLTSANEAAIDYLHYIHGVNPLGLEYLSNMYRYGGDRCVNEFYHSWFTNGSAKWDRVGKSTYGPPPGFLPGGPNPSYTWDGCCDKKTCGSTANNAICTSESISPPMGQPSQKSYKDFNTSWPLNSWSVTENSCGYQINYIRLLSKFVHARMDCNGDIDGTATLDTCGICSGGNTGISPIDVLCNCPEKQLVTLLSAGSCTNDYLSPSGKYRWIEAGNYADTLLGKSGCDSALLVQLSFYQPTESQLQLTVCDYYLSPSGNYRWTASGTYNDTIPNEAGCDSIITFELTVNRVEALVTVDTGVLTAQVEGAGGYRWFHQDGALVLIAGETDQQLTPPYSGYYAVEVTKNGCVDTSEQIYVLVNELAGTGSNGGVAVFPNPNYGTVEIQCATGIQLARVEVYDLSGNLLVLADLHQQEGKISFSHKLLPGLYFLELTAPTGEKLIRKIAVVSR